ncbi:uncharacterized protein LOC128229016 [Mya arenaria]|uniref:uncharacterized protein LOC128229016 n=1 Tax=Mya arenaria TaxID=6604 RepID=UPI0022E93E19|nr:uncharacterized protein LOC128229016 [Mya arenaria]
MRTLTGALFVLGLAAIVSSEGDYKHMEDWAHQWYDNEPYYFRCTEALGNISAHDYDRVSWVTPKGVIESNTSDYYTLRDADGVKSAEIVIHKIEPALHGVYVCKVYNVSGNLVNKTIFGLNVHEAKPRSYKDKYQRNINVAVISSAVFLVPVLSLCLLHHYSWEKRHPEFMGRKKYAVDDSHEMNRTASKNGGLAATVASPEGKGAYENPDGVSTQM